MSGDRGVSVEQAGSVTLWRDREVRRLALVGLCGMSGFTLLLAAVPVWGVRNGLPASSAGLITTAMLAATVAAQPVVPALERRFGPGPVLAAGLILLGAPAPFCAVCHQLPPLLVIAILRGCGFGAVTVITSALTLAVAPPGRHGESVGVFGLATALPMMIGVPLGALLTNSGSFAWAALLAAAPLAALPAAMRLGAALPRRPAEAPDRSRPRLRQRGLLTIAAPSLMLFVVTFGFGGVTTFLPVARPDGLTATLALLCVGAATVLMRWLIGPISDRMGADQLLTAALVLAGAGVIVMAVGLPSRVPGIVAVLGGALFGLGCGATQNLTLVLAFQRADLALIPAASALWNASFDAGTGLGAGATGRIADWGAGLPAALGGQGVLILCAALVALLARTLRVSRQQSNLQ